VELPSDALPLEAEVVRLRRMVHALAEMLVECGVVDASMVEGRLRLASAAVRGEADGTVGELSDVSLKKPSLWSRIFGKKQPPPVVGAVPAVMMPVDQTVPVQKMSFEVQSLYDEHGGSSVVAPGQTLGSAPKQAPTTVARATVGNCSRCWRRAPLQTGQICARCAIQNG
jgi:hypothetical protein